MDTPTSPTGASTSARAGRRYYSLDSWRGMACLMVVVYHAEMYYAQSPHFGALWKIGDAIARRMWIGVPLFFVISGYCISATADTERNRRSGVRDYFKRRLRRIFPPYWAAVGLSVLTFILFPAFLSNTSAGIPGFVPPANLTLLDWLGSISLTETWLPNFFHHMARTFDAGLLLGPAWTLCYEEQFYAVTGLLLLIPRRFFAGAVGVTAITALCVWGHVHLTGLFLDGRWLEFAAGIAIYYAVNYGSRRFSIVTGLVLIVGILHWARAPRKLLHAGPDDFGFSMAVACAFALAILLLKRWDKPLFESGIAKPLNFCGMRCYSIYLVHFPLVKLLSCFTFTAGFTGPRFTFFILIPACVALSAGYGAGFHYFVERHFLNTSRNGAVLKVKTPA